MWSSHKGYISTTTAVSAARTALRDVFLPAKGHAAVTAVAGLNQDSDFVDKHRKAAGLQSNRRPESGEGSRDRDYATNVLSFGYGASGDALEGDLVLCAPVLRREARAQGKPLAAHVAHLAVHGALHLQGYDHETPRAAARMEALETRILAKLGFPDPYAANA